MATKLNAHELDELNATDLEAKLREAKEELFNLRFQAATGQLESHGRLRVGQEGHRPHLHRGARARARHPHHPGSTNTEEAKA